MVRFAIGAIVLLLAAPSGIAQNVDVRVTTVYGLDGAVYSDRWNPLAVTVSNLADPVTAIVVVESTLESLTGRQASRFRLQAPVELLTGERETLHLVVPVRTAALQTRISVVVDGRVEHEDELTPSRVAGRPPATVYLGSGPLPQPLLDYDLSQPRVEYLPEHWIGYQPVELIVLSRPPLARMSPGQSEAMEQWVKSGGVVLWLTSRQRIVADTAGLRVLFPELHDTWSGATAPATPSDESPEGFQRHEYGQGRLFVLVSDAVSQEAFQGALATALSSARSLGPPDVSVTGSLTGLTDRRRRIVDLGEFWPLPNRWVVLFLLAAYVATVALAVRVPGKEHAGIGDQEEATGPSRPPPDPSGSLLARGAVVAAAVLVTAGLAILNHVNGDIPAVATVELQHVTGVAAGDTTLVKREVALVATQPSITIVTLPPGVVPVPPTSGQLEVFLRAGRFAVSREAKRWHATGFVTIELAPSPLTTGSGNDGTNPGESVVAIENVSSVQFDLGALITSQEIVWFGPLSPGQTLQIEPSGAGSKAEHRLARGAVSAPTPSSVQSILAQRRFRELVDDSTRGPVVLAWSSSPIVPATVAHPPVQAETVTSVVEFLVER